MNWLEIEKEHRSCGTENVYVSGNVVDGSDGSTSIGLTLEIST